jgi:predicted nucleic acid-binding protein
VIVIDASVVVIALADDGEDGARVRARLRANGSFAPQLLDIEVTSDR